MFEPSVIFSVAPSDRPPSQKKAWVETHALPDIDG